MPEVKSYKELPSDPGCYLYKDKSGKVIYVGKAKNLRKRVASYFTKNDHDPKTALLIPEINSIDFFVTKTEVEALLLENNLIKKYYPYFNLDLKDSRRYAYLRLSTDEFPLLEVARTREEPGEYFGPFVSGMYRREIQELLRRNFGILTSKPSSLKRKSIDPIEYKTRIKKARAILKGDVDALIKQLTEEMTIAAEKKFYEHALKLRGQISAVLSLKEKQSMELRKNYDADVINYVQYGDIVYLLVFSMYRGVLENKQEFELPFSENFLEEFIVQYYASALVPKEVIVPVALDDAVREFLSRMKGSSVALVFPQVGVKKELLRLAEKNVKMALHGAKERVFDLKAALRLKNDPIQIECFDISHLRGKFTVASMVSFRNGAPYKSHYRRFKIIQDTNGDDFTAMREVVYRRYGKSLSETMPLPDLIVIDGGRGQLNAARSALASLNINTPVISLAKKLEEVYTEDSEKPLKLPDKQPGLLLLRAIRDEAHRFAITFNRELRSKNLRK